MVLKRKRGLSPVVATVLLVALAMILAMIIFLWARGWIFEQIEKKGTPIDQVCESIEIRVDWSKTPANNLLISVVNLGSTYINSVEIRQESRDSSTPYVLNISAPPLGTSTPREVFLELGVNKVIIYPQLIGNIKGKQDNKVTTCLNKGKVINIE